jgi:hypothetical protein
MNHPLGPHLTVGYPLKGLSGRGLVMLLEIARLADRASGMHVGKFHLSHWRPFVSVWGHYAVMEGANR